MGNQLVFFSFWVSTLATHVVLTLTCHGPAKGLDPVMGLCSCDVADCFLEVQVLHFDGVDLPLKGVLYVTLDLLRLLDLGRLNSIKLLNTFLVPALNHLELGL